MSEILVQVAKELGRLVQSKCANWRTKMNPRKTTFGISFCVASLVLLFNPALNSQPQSSRKGDQGDPVLGHRIAKGIVSDGRLWLRGTEVSRKGGPGGLVSLNLTDNSRTVYFQRGVVDIEKSGHDLWVLRQSSAELREYIVSVWKNGAFSDLAHFTSPGKDEPVVLLNIGASPAVLSRGTLSLLSGDHSDWRTIRLKGELRWGVQMSVASPKIAKAIYFGINRGEWGGGLQEVDIETGVVSNIERRDTNDLCRGPLNSDCDPVTGVISDPQNDDCVLAAVGLVHLSISEGRILRVCGNTVTPISDQPITGGMGGKMKMTEAFYGLAPAEGGGFWGLTWRALYRFSADGKQQKEYALPKLAPVSGIYISRDLPGVIVVRTDVNWAVSTSGYTQLLVPLEGS
jgi:hypothetical protein